MRQLELCQGLGSWHREQQSAKALGPEQAWHAGGIARRSVHCREGSGGTALCLRGGVVGWQGSQVQEEWGSVCLFLGAAVGFLLCDHTFFNYLEPGHTGLPIFTLLQFSSVAWSHLTLCDPMDCSTPGFPVHHQLLELAQTHVHWVGDAIQPSYPLLSPSPPSFSLSQHQGLFQWASSLHQMAKVLEFQL